MRFLTKSAAAAALVLSACWADAPPSGGGDGAPDAKHLSEASTDDVPSSDDDGALADGGVSGDTGTGGPTGSGARCGFNGTNACGPYQACDDLLGCVDCLSDPDCPLTSRHCLVGSCVTCRSDLPDAGADASPAESDCPIDAPSCWPADHACHPNCGDAAPCPSRAPNCDLATGQCWTCVTDADCPNEVCSRVTRQCVQCQADTDCSRASPRCDVKSGVCHECASNDDCGLRAPVCDPATRTCILGCISDAGCGAERCDEFTASCVAVDAGAADSATDLDAAEADATGD